MTFPGWLKIFMEELGVLWKGRDPFPKGLAFLGLFLIFLLGGSLVLQTSSSRERGVIARVDQAQNALYGWMREKGMDSPRDKDPLESGFIGVEWSRITTTLGSLKAKQTATDPRWSAFFLRWYKAMELCRGDSLGILCSGSFPGLVLSSLMAAEDMGLKVVLLPSLGASTWGANRENCTILDMLAFFYREGFIRTFPRGCSLGGDNDMAQELSPQGREILRASAQKQGVLLWETSSLQEMVLLKMSLLEEARVRGVVSIGGGASSLGDDSEVLHLPGGLLRPQATLPRGNGLIQKVLESGIPVIHMLHLRSLCFKTGLPYPPLQKELILPGRIPQILAFLGVVTFVSVLLWHQRWKRE